MPVPAFPRWLRISSLSLYRLVTWTVLVAGIAFAVLVLSLRYWILPNIDQYRDSIAHVITKAINQRIAIGKVSGNWDGLRPELVLENVTVFDHAGRPALRLSRVENTLSWFSLAALEPRFRSIEIHRPALDIRRDSRGVFFIAGIELKGGEGGGFADWLLRQRELVVRQAEISWHDELRGVAPLQLKQVELLIRNRGSRHRFGMRAVPPQRLAGQFDLRGEVTGNSTTALASWQGKLFVRVDSVDIDAWRPWIPLSIPISKGAGALRMWATFRENRLTDAIADVRLADARMQLAQDLPALDLVTLSGRVGWKRSTAGIEFSTTRLGLTTAGGLTLQPTDFLLRLSTGTDKGSARGELRANALDLEPLAMLADSLPLDPQLRKKLVELSPEGSLFDLTVRWNGEWNAPTQYVAYTRFHDLAMKGFDKVPGFSGVSGTVEGSEKAGTIHFDSTNVTLDMPKVFRGPLAFDTIVADVAWSHTATGPELQFNTIAFSNPHLAGSVSGNYRIVRDGGVIDLTGTLTRADARYASPYIPLVIGESTRNWLDTAVLSGQSSDVSLRLKGNLSDFPFPDNKGGIFHVVAKVTGGVLDYAAGWPRIENIAGDLVFRGRKMEVNARQGTILGAKLLKVHAEIPDLVTHYELLRVDGEAEGPTAEFLSYIEKSPVLDMIDRFTQGMRAQGSGKLALKLEMPLRAHEKSKIAGSYQFLGNRLVATPELPPLEGASGRLEFTESMVRVPNATATFLGGPIVMSTAPQSDATVRINVEGRANIDNLRQSAGNPWWTQRLRGAADWKGTFILRKKLADLVIESNLQGIASDLPAPLAKTAADGVPLRVERRFISREQDQVDQIDVSYGKLISARLVRRLGGSDDIIRRGTIRFGGGAAPEPEREGVWVSGTLKRLDLDRWLTLTEDETRPASLEVSGVDVKFDELIVLNRDFHEVAVNGAVQEGTWRATLSGREFDGTATWQSQGRGKLTARMKKLVIPPSIPTQAAEESPSRPRDLPALDVSAEQFQFKDKALGKLELLATAVERDWRIDRLRIVNPDGVLAVEGLVQNIASQPRTRATVHLDVSDIGKFLARLGYPEGVRRGTAKLDGTLAWPGGPQDFEYAALAGNLTLAAAKGQFVKLEPGIGKLLGILSLQALPRRITLDFRDIFSKGFAFDQIVSAVSIERGIATTDNFVILGPAARILMTGDVDLARETQKLHVRIIPGLSDSLSIASLLGGPVAGVATFLAQKVLKDPLDQLFANEYNVTGTWAEPQVSKVERPAPAATDAP